MWRELEIGRQEKAGRKLCQMCESHMKNAGWLAGERAREGTTHDLLSVADVSDPKLRIYMPDVPLYVEEEAYVLYAQCAT